MLTLIFYLCSVECVFSLHTTNEYNIADTVPTPPLITDEADKLIVYVHDGSPFEVTCIGSGSPTPSYQWTMNGYLFDPSGVDGRIYMKPEEGTLVFVRPLDRDEGRYQCEAYNELGSAFSVMIYLRPAYLNSFPLLETYEYHPMLGDSLYLSCAPPESYPGLQYDWVVFDEATQASTPVITSQRVQIDPQGSLIFVNIVNADNSEEDYYRCRVYNNVLNETLLGHRHSVRPQGSIPITYPPTIAYASPTNIILLRGDIARIRCIMSGNPTPNVTWQRYGGEFPPGTYVDNFGTELVIPNVDFDDAGTYECEASNNMTPIPVRKSFQLYIEALPEWTVMPASVNASVGDNVTITCEAEGIPEATNFWAIDGQPVSALPPDAGLIVEPYRLLFLNVTEDDIGVVQCNATNKHGYVFANAYLNIIS